LPGRFRNGPGGARRALLRLQSADGWCPPVSFHYRQEHWQGGKVAAPYHFFVDKAPSGRRLWIIMSQACRCLLPGLASPGSDPKTPSMEVFDFWCNFAVLSSLNTHEQ
jgi:hypothetical protein